MTRKKKKPVPVRKKKRYPAKVMAHLMRMAQEEDHRRDMLDEMERAGMQHFSDL